MGTGNTGAEGVERLGVEGLDINPVNLGSLLVVPPSGQDLWTSAHIVARQPSGLADLARLESFDLLLYEDNGRLREVIESDPELLTVMDPGIYHVTNRIRMKLNVKSVATRDEALSIMRSQRYDLVSCTLNPDYPQAGLDFVKYMKAPGDDSLKLKYANVPLVLCEPGDNLFALMMSLASGRVHPIGRSLWIHYRG